MSRFKALKTEVQKFSSSRHGRLVLRAARTVFLIGVVAWLIHELSEIGWGQVWASRPRTPWFYVIWLVMYAQLPLVETLLYRTLWGVPFRELLPPIHVHCPVDMVYRHRSFRYP